MGSRTSGLPGSQVFTGQGQRERAGRLAQVGGAGKAQEGERQEEGVGRKRVHPIGSRCGSLSPFGLVGGGGEDEVRGTGGWGWKMMEDDGR